MCVCVCVCVFVYVCVCSIPTHCTITCFGFHSMRIDGVSVIYFRFTHSWADDVYVGDVCLYLCTERVGLG